MNIQLCLILFLGMVGMPLFAQTNIFFESYKNEEIQVSFRDSIYRATLDENGVGTIFVPASLKPDYAIIYGPRGVYQFYLLPSGKQRIERYQDGRMLFSGAGKDINEYLTGPVLSSLNFDYSKDFKSFFTQWKGTPEKLQAYLDSIDLPDEFKYIERKRLYYVACNLLQVYPLYHKKELDFFSNSSLIYSLFFSYIAFNPSKVKNLSTLSMLSVSEAIRLARPPVATTLIPSQFNSSFIIDIILSTKPT